MLGATYCASNPPDAATQAILTSRGESVNIIPCGYSTGQPNLPTNAGITPVAAGNAPPAPTPYSFGSYPGQEDCQPLDGACVQRNTVREVAYQNNYYQTQVDYNRALCKQNAYANGSDQGACDTRWPAGSNQTQPYQQPTVPSVIDVSNPANQAGTTSTTGTTILPSLPTAFSNILAPVEASTGMSQTTLLVIAAIAGIYLLKKG